MDIEKLRAQPEIIAPEYFNKLKQEFSYIPMTDQVKVYIVWYSISGYIMSNKIQVFSFMLNRIRLIVVPLANLRIGKTLKIGLITLGLEKLVSILYFINLISKESCL